MTIMYYRFFKMMAVKYCPLLLCLLLTGVCNAQNRTVTYTESSEDIVNPERGFYIPSGTKASKFVPLTASQLSAYRTAFKQPGKASYAVKVSLIYRGYELDIFKHQALPDSFLLKLQDDFDAVRNAGLKMILRFAYTNSAKTGDCPDVYKICPPYGDAPKDIVLTHVRQLKPLFQKNKDVIAVVQEGFIGIWGENYFTDYFGDASTNGSGTIADSSWLHRNELLNALLESVPADRMVQVRTPQIKQKFVYGPSASVNSRPLTQAAAHNFSNTSRIGFHNDCFLASKDDYGTYYDYGSSSQPRQAANEVLRNYIGADTKFTVAGGETCDDAFSPQNDCAPAGYAEQEIRSMHYSYLNASYNTAVINDWDSGGCLYNIRRKLGYRLVLRSSTFPAKIKRDAPLNIKLVIENTGYASMYNPRPAGIVFRNIRTGDEYTLTLKADPRFWYSGKHEIKESVTVPAQMIKGQYQLYLSLPDAGAMLQKRPEYAVQLCNKNTWEPLTGYNNLHQSIQIE